MAFGSNPRACAIYVREAVPIALRFWMDKDHIFCQDVIKEQILNVAPGYRRTLGTTEILVRSSGGQESPVKE